MSAIQQVVDDKGFKISVIATIAQQFAQDIKSWSSENKDEFEEFSKVLLMEIEKAFIGTVRTKRSIINRDKLWKNYFLLQSSKDFAEKWGKFLESAPTKSKGQGAHAILYQRLTDIIFKCVLKEHYQISNDTDNKEASLDDNECNVLRYVASCLCVPPPKKKA